MKVPQLRLLAVGPLVGWGRRGACDRFSGTPSASFGSLSLVADSRNLPIVCCWPYCIENVTVNVVPFSFLIASLASNRADVGLAELRQDGPAGRRVVVDRPADRPALLREVGLHLCKAAAFDSVGLSVGAAFTVSSFSTKLPFSARPGPFAGRLSSGSTSSRRAVMSFSLRRQRDRVGVRCPGWCR